MTEPTPPAANYQQPVQPQPYGTQPYGAPQYGAPQYAAGPRTNTLAIISLVLALVGVSLGGIICGHLALGQIKRTGEAGHGLALAGTIIGYVGAGLLVLYIIFMIGIFVLSLGTAAYTVTSVS